MWQYFLGNIVRNETKPFYTVSPIVVENKHQQRETRQFHYHCVYLTIRQGQSLVFAHIYSS